MATIKSKARRQIEYLAERLQRCGERPNIGKCLLCGKVDGEDLDCSQCWADASEKVAETLMRNERETVWGDFMTEDVAAIPFTRLKPHQWYSAQIENFALTEPGWICITWPNMPLHSDWTDGSDRLLTMADFISGLEMPYRNTFTFWPCENRDVFWSGVEELGSLVVVAFGKTAAERIGLPSEDWKPLHWVKKNNAIIVSLWSMEQILETPSRLDDCITYLRATLWQIGLLEKSDCGYKVKRNG